MKNTISFPTCQILSVFFSSMTPITAQRTIISCDLALMLGDGQQQLRFCPSSKSEQSQATDSKELLTWGPVGKGEGASPTSVFPSDKGGFPGSTPGPSRLPLAAFCPGLTGRSMLFSKRASNESN